MRVAIRENEINSRLIIINGWIAPLLCWHHAVLLLTVCVETLEVGLARCCAVGEGANGRVGDVRGGRAAETREFIDTALTSPWNAVLSEELL